MGVGGVSSFQPIRIKGEGVESGQCTAQNKQEKIKCPLRGKTYQARLG